MLSMLAQEAVPQIPGLSPNLQFVFTLLTMLIPLVLAIYRAYLNGKTLNSVIVGAEQGSNAAVVAAQGLLARAARGEKVSPEEIARIVDSKFKTGIQAVAVLDGTEEHLAPRVQKATEGLDPAEL